MQHRHGVALVLLGWCAVAHAGPSHADLATANALYAEGKRLTVEGRIGEACARYEASLALVARLGVQINLAQCQEREGKLASAWLAYGEAAALAHRLGDAREAWAWQQHNALSARLARVVITVDARAGGELVVTRDGAAVPRSAYGIGVPVDPGEHTVEAKAPGRVAWSTRLRVTREGELVAIAVPELAREPRAPLQAAASRAVRRRPSLATWLALGGGGAAIAAGVGLRLSARSLWHQAQPGCDSSNACSDRAIELIARSRRDSALGNGALVVGGAALFAGALLYLRSTGPAERRVEIAPTLTRDTVGIALSGGL